MNPRFLRPNIIWAGVWLAVFMAIFIIGYWQSNLYWENTFERVQQREFKILRDVSPYALAFLEEHGQTDLIRQILNPDKELFTLVYTDLSGAIKFSSPSASTPQPGLTNIKNHKFMYVYKSPSRGRTPLNPKKPSRPPTPLMKPRRTANSILWPRPPRL